VGIGGGEGRHASLRDAVVVPFLIEVDLQGQITRYVERDLRTEDHCTFLRSEGIVVGFQIAAEAERDVLDRAERKDFRVREGVGGGFGGPFLTMPSGFASSAATLAVFPRWKSTPKKT